MDPFGLATGAAARRGSPVVLNHLFCESSRGCPSSTSGRSFPPCPLVHSCSCCAFGAFHTVSASTSFLRLLSFFLAKRRAVRFLRTTVRCRTSATHGRCPGIHAYVDVFQQYWTNSTTRSIPISLYSARLYSTGGLHFASAAAAAAPPPPEVSTRFLAGQKRTGWLATLTCGLPRNYMLVRVV